MFPQLGYRARVCVCVIVCVCVCLPIPRVGNLIQGWKGDFRQLSSCGACAIPFRAVQPHHQQTFGEDLPANQDGEQPGPSRRKRQPSMSETMPLYTLCKEDLESMDKEVSPAQLQRASRAASAWPSGLHGTRGRGGDDSGK